MRRSTLLLLKPGLTWDPPGLPTSDLESARLEFAVIRQDGQVVAAGALQRFSTSALLRLAKDLAGAT